MLRPVDELTTAIRSALGRVVGARGAVRLVGRGVRGEIGVDSSGLVGGLFVDVGEAATGREAGDSNFLIFGGGSALGEDGSAGGGDVGA